jgi:hypothetical protein
MGFQKTFRRYGTPKPAYVFVGPQLPSNIAGATFWIDFSQSYGRTLGSSNRVTGLKDLTNNGHDLTAPDDTTAPVLDSTVASSGKSCATFTAANLQKMTVSTPLAGVLGGAKTIAAVYYRTAVSTRVFGLAMSNGEIPLDHGPTDILDVTPDGWINVPGQDATGTGWRITIAQDPGDAWSGGISQQGGGLGRPQYYTSSAHPNVSCTNFGFDGTATYTTGKLVEYLYWPNNTVTVANIFAYLNGKYAIV